MDCTYGQGGSCMANKRQALLSLPTTHALLNLLCFRGEHTRVAVCDQIHMRQTWLEYKKAQMSAIFLCF